MKAAIILVMVALATSAPAFHQSTPPLVASSGRGSTHAQSQVPATTTPTPHPSVDVHTFEQRWWPGDGTFAQQPLTFEERWAPVAQTWGRRVKTITILPPPPEPRQEALEAIATAAPLPRERPSTAGRERPEVDGTKSLSRFPGSTPAKPRPNRVADLCSRHGMHKQVTNGGKSWRCRR